eukprot:TRINITY_DN64185_c0_g1_i1.p1 TRINITY_DN64185_c0_g1~~TRINITY_DN64185_c0_g1_i1.p1  ORF type:complete len:211 (+),score=38.13 TRINITY_DN64185_c0_g1_i1:65-634(+)
MARMVDRRLIALLAAVLLVCLCMPSVFVTVTPSDFQPPQQISKASSEEAGREYQSTAPIERQEAANAHIRFEVLDVAMDASTGNATETFSARLFEFNRTPGSEVELSNGAFTQNGTHQLAGQVLHASETLSIDDSYEPHAGCHCNRVLGGETPPAEHGCLKVCSTWHHSRVSMGAVVMPDGPILFSSEL